MARDVGVVLRKNTLRETINQTRQYAGIEASMRLRDNSQETVAAVEGAATKPKKKDKSKAEGATIDHTADPGYAALTKQVAAIASRVGELQTGTRKPHQADGHECYSCGKTGHFARDCRSGPRRGTQTRGGRGPPRGHGPTRGHVNTRSQDCYTCGQPGHFARDCYQQGQQQLPARGRGNPCGGYQRGRRGYHQQTSYGPGPSGGEQQSPASMSYNGYPQCPAAQGQQVATATTYNQQGNW